MAHVNVDPKNEPKPYLEEGGTYGPGLDHEAVIEVTEFVSPNEEGMLVSERGFDVMPGYDREGAKGTYWYWNFKVTTDEGRIVFLRAHTQESKLKKWLLCAGVPISENEDGTFSFDPDDVAPRELKGGIDVKDPRFSEATDKWYSGDVKAVFAG